MSLLLANVLSACQSRSLDAELRRAALAAPADPPERDRPPQFASQIDAAQALRDRLNRERVAQHDR